MSMRLAVVAAILASTFAVLAAQQPQPGGSVGIPGAGASPAQPPRVPPRAVWPGDDPQKGTSVLRGYVTAADTGDPVRRALVRAFSQDGRSSGIATTDADGRFEIKELVGVPGETVEALNIVLTRRLTEISGQITADRNAPDTNATVVVFSENPDRWTFGSRYVRIVRPNQDGRYTLRGMPPHEYLVVAVKDIEPGRFQDPEFLESVRTRAVRVSLNEGESKVQDLKSPR